jgi:prepilin-type N-terminal cleavage/methylation domain-containing protein
MIPGQGDRGRARWRVRRMDLPDHGREAGLTLIELLAAMVVSAFVVAMASRIFLSGHAQFVRRSAESEKIALFYRLKAEVEAGLKGEIQECSGGKLALLTDSGQVDLATRLRARLPALTEARFDCLEPDATGSGLQAWKDADQPALVDYNLRVKVREQADSLTGSWLR